MPAFFDYFLTPLGERGKAFPLAEPPCRVADGTDGAARGALLLSVASAARHGSRLPHSGRTNGNANCESEQEKHEATGRMQEHCCCRKRVERDRESCVRRRRASDAHSTPCACSFVDRERSTKAAFPKRSFGAQRRLGGRRHYAASGRSKDGSREHRRTCDLDARLPPSAVSLPFRKLHRQRDAPAASRCASVRPVHIDAPRPPCGCCPNSAKRGFRAKKAREQVSRRRAGAAIIHHVRARQGLLALDLGRDSSLHP